MVRLERSEKVEQFVRNNENLFIQSADVLDGEAFVQSMRPAYSYLYAQRENGRNRRKLIIISISIIIISLAMLINVPPIKAHIFTFLRLTEEKSMTLLEFSSDDIVYIESFQHPSGSIQHDYSFGDSAILVIMRLNMEQFTHSNDSEIYSQIRVRGLNNAIVTITKEDDGCVAIFEYNGYSISILSTIQDEYAFEEIIAGMTHK